MNYRMIGRFIGKMLLVEAAFMIPALLISIFEREPAAVQGFLIAMGITLVLAALLLVLCRKTKRGFHAREGLVCVGVSWIIMGLLGCLPYYFSGEIPSFIDALFESVSGFTTTGASILSDVESLSKGILYWRSFSHWLGCSYSCWRYRLEARIVRDLQCTCLEQKARDQASENWFRR